MMVKLGAWYVNLNEVDYIHREGTGCIVKFKDGTEIKIRVIIHDEEFDAITK